MAERPLEAIGGLALLDETAPGMARKGFEEVYQKKAISPSPGQRDFVTSPGKSQDAAPPLSVEAAPPAGRVIKSVEPNGSSIIVTPLDPPRHGREFAPAPNQALIQGADAPAPEQAKAPLSSGYLDNNNKVAKERIGPGDTAFFNKSEKQQRAFEIHLPPGYSDDKPVPAVFVMGGVNESIASLKQDSGLNQIADEKGFAVIYMEALPKIMGLNAWSMEHGAMSTRDQRYNDLNYVKKVHRQVENLASLVKSKEYLVGHSEGGDSAQWVARNMPGVFAGIGGIKSTRLADDPLPRKNDPTAAVFVIGDQDPVLSPLGGTMFLPLNLVANNIWKSRPTMQARAFARANECSNPRTSTYGDDVITSYTCKQAPVEQIVQRGGDHHWHDPDPRINTSRQVVDFLLSYEKPSKQAPEPAADKVKTK